MTPQELEAIVRAAPHCEACHLERYRRTWEWLAPLITGGTRVLDVGGESPFTEVMRHAGAVVQTTGDRDLRYPLDIAAAFDVIVCTEVIEHLKDREACDRATFTGSGISSLLSELRRLVAPGGALFLTTPNLACWRGIQRLLKGEHPHQYPLHVREMPAPEVVQRIEAAGWKIERQGLVSVWKDHYVPENERAAISELARRLYGSDELLKGDCLFVLARPG